MDERRLSHHKAIPYQQNELLQHILVGEDSRIAHTEKLKLLDHRQGLQTLFGVLYENQAVESLRPFELDISLVQPEIKKNYTPRFHYGYARHKEFSINIPTEVLNNNNGSIWVIPRTHPVRKHAYHWIEFYNPDDQVSPRIPFKDCSLRTTESGNKLDFLDWHGIGEELLGDYVEQKNGIQFEDLLPASFIVTNPALYRLAARKNLPLRFNNNPAIQKNDILHITPRQDEQKLYSWIDLEKRGADGAAVHLQSYRIHRESKTLNNRYWYGPEVQCLVDYMSGTEGIRFHNLQPIHFSPGNKKIFTMSMQSDKELTFALPKNVFEEGDDAVLMPKQDEYGLYEWLELYKVDKQTRTPTGACVGSGRLVNRKIVQKYWHGPQTEYFKEFQRGRVAFEKLKPLELVVGAGIYIYLYQEKDIKARLQLSHLFNLQKGDLLLLSPETQTATDSLFLLKKGDETLGRYRWDPEAGFFICTMNFVVNRDVQLVFDPSTQCFSNDQGEQWLTQQAASERLGVSVETFKKYFSSVSSFQYMSQHAPKRLRLYHLSEVMNTYETLALKLAEKTDNPMISAQEIDEANKWISRLLD